MISGRQSQTDRCIITPAVPSERTQRRIDRLLLGCATRPFAYRTRGLEPNDEPLRVGIAGPLGATRTWGNEDAANRIEGSAGEFCRVVTQRIHYLDTSLRWQGEAARKFLEVAQSFAGPPAAGRPPKKQSQA